MRYLAYGAGTDSTGILAGWLERGLQESEPIDLIVFADTGNERPHTYEFLETHLRPWLAKHGFPDLSIVRKGGRQETLEENCLRKQMLPSLAYGLKGCSHKFKVEPQEAFANKHPGCREAWKRGELVEKLIGYEFREERRWRRAKREDDKYEYRFPLVEWQWNRPEAQAAILRVGLPLPGKSSCFFCPASTLPELEQLRSEYPVLFHRALALEDNALPNLTSVKGLGRRFNWRQWHEGTEAPAADDLAAEPCRVCIDN